MGRSGSLRVADVRSAYRLIGECRDTGGDPIAWQTRMCEGLRLLIGSDAATGGEGTIAPAGVVPSSSVEAGLDAAGRRALAAYMEADGPAHDPFIVALLRRSARPATRTRRQLVRDAAYYGSPTFQRYMRPAGADHRLASVHRTMAQRTLLVINLQRGPGDRDFSPRDRALLHFFQTELAPLVGRALATATEPGVHDLPPRLRQTLACLLEGDSERQAAARLGISATTLHQYVTMLYRRFRVRSRGQLVAHVTGRSAGRPASSPTGRFGLAAPGRAPAHCWSTSTQPRSCMHSAKAPAAAFAAMP